MGRDTQAWLDEHPNAGLLLFCTFGAALVAVVLLTNWPTYHYEVRGGPLPLYYYALPGLFIIPLVCAEPGHPGRIMKEPLFWWFVVYVVSGAVWLLLAQDFIEDSAGNWRLRLLAFLLFYTIAILTVSVKRPVIAYVMIACVILATAANWFDILRPFRFVAKGIEGAHSGRGAGFFINPNIAASFIVMTTIGALPFVPMRLRGFVLLCAVVGVVPTFSRSGLLEAGLMVFGAVALKMLNRTQAVFVLVALPVLGVATATSYDFLMQSSDDVNLHNVVKRLEWFQGLAEEDMAVDARLYGAHQAWQMFLDMPLTGGGLGATRREATGMEGPHNMYLTMMGEQGFLGLALYIGLIAVVARRGWYLVKTALDDDGRNVGRALILYAVFLFVYGFFSHNVLEEPHGMFALGFLTAAALAAQRRAASAAAVQYPEARAVGPRPPSPALGRLKA